MPRITRAVLGAIFMLAALVAAPAAGAQEPAPSPLPQSSAIPSGGATAGAAEQPPLVRILERRLVTSGATVSIRARALWPLSAELRVVGEGRAIATAAVGVAGGRFRLQGSAAHGARLELVVRRTDGVEATQTRNVGTVQRRKLRRALASWYGPGLYGNRTACGQTLTTGLRGVAHRTLPCGTTITVRYRGKTTQAKVVDRGPFHGNREFDLTFATARAINFGDIGTIHVSR